MILAKVFSTFLANYRRFLPPGSGSAWWMRIRRSRIMRIRIHIMRCTRGCNFMLLSLVFCSFCETRNQRNICVEKYGNNSLQCFDIYIKKSCDTRNVKSFKSVFSSLNFVFDLTFFKKLYANLSKNTKTLYNRQSWAPASSFPLTRQ